MKTKKLLLAFLMAVFGVAQLSAYTVYYYNASTYGEYDGNSGSGYSYYNYKYAVRCYNWSEETGESSLWTDWMTAVPNHDNWYQVNVPDGYNSLEFYAFKQYVSDIDQENSSFNTYATYDGVNAYYWDYDKNNYGYDKRGFSGWQSKFDIIHDVLIGELYYNLDGELKTAEVTYPHNDYYSRTIYSFSTSTITIPSTVSYEEQNYTVTSIGKEAFAGSGLTTINIPSSVLFIAETAFRRGGDMCYDDVECYASLYNLTAVNVASENPNYCSQDGILFDKNKTVLMLYPHKKENTSYVVPNSVTRICPYVFADNEALNAITLSDHLMKIEAGTFYDCNNLKAINIPASVDSIKEYAFRNCSALTNVTLHEGLKFIGNSVFYGCSSIASIYLPEGITDIGWEAFFGCSSLTSIELPSTLKYLGWIFNGYYNFESIKIPTTVKHYGEYVLEDVKKNAPEEYEENKEEYDNIYSTNRLTVAGFVVWTGYQAAIVDQRYQLTMPKLTKVEAPAWFFDVPEDNWPICPKYLENIVINNGELNDNVFGVINRSYKTLKSLDVSATTNTTLADEAFKDNYNLTSLILPANLTRVSYMAVAGCKNLKAIDIPASVVEIDQSAFEDCRSIETITFGGVQPSAVSGKRNAPNAASQLKRIGNWAFYNAHELQHLEIPEGVEEIGDGAFYGCTYLQDLVLPSSVKSMGDNCFALCSKLEKITVNSTTPPTIKAKTFYDVKRQIPVYVPADCVDAYTNDPYWGEFNIVGQKSSQGIDQITNDQSPVTNKIIRDGQLFIRRGDNIYTVTGQEVK